MLNSLSALAFAATLLGRSGSATAQCPPAAIGAHLDGTGASQSAVPIHGQDLHPLVMLHAEAPSGGTAWRPSTTSPQFSGPPVGPAGPNCQPPWCSHQDPPFWPQATFYRCATQLGDPIATGVRQIHDGPIFAGFTARVRPTVSGLVSHLGATVVEGEEMSWGSVKALYLR